MGINDKTKEKVAVKIINKSLIRNEGKKMLEKVENEIWVMKILSKEGGHENIIKLIGIE